MIQFRYALDGDAILILIQISTIRYRLDTLQTWKPFYFSFRFNYQIQFRYTPDTEVILSLIQIPVQIHSRHGSYSVTHSDTVRIRSRHGCHSVTYSDFPQLRDALDTVVILSLIQISDSDTIPDALQTRKSFFYSFNIQTQLQLGYAPDTDAIPLLIQTQSPDIVRICSRHGYHSDTHSFDL